MKRSLKYPSARLPRFILPLIVSLPFTMTVWNLNGLKAADLSAPGDSIDPAAHEKEDSVRAGGGMRIDELKSMIIRETGEPMIEGTAWARKKNPKTAMLCALAIPGLGQIYNEKPIKAALAAGFEVFYLSRILHFYRMEKREAAVRDAIPRWITTAGETPVTYQNFEWTRHDLWVEEYKERQVDYIWWSAGCILVIVLDAYIDAHLHDMNFRIENSPMEGSAGLSLVVDF